MAQGTHHRIVFDARRDDAIATMDDTVEGYVERMRGVPGEDNPAWIWRVEELREAFTCILDQTSGLNGHPVAGPSWVAAGIREVLIERKAHGRWFRPGGRGIVKI